MKRLLAVLAVACSALAVPGTSGAATTPAPTSGTTTSTLPLPQSGSASFQSTYSKLEAEVAALTAGGSTSPTAPSATLPTQQSLMSVARQMLAEQSRQAVAASSANAQTGPGGPGALASSTGTPTTATTQSDTSAQGQASQSSGLLSPCLGEMMDVAASGQLPSAGTANAQCSGCANAGLFLHNEVNGLLNPQATNPVPNAASSIIPPAELASLPSWEANAITSQNPALAAGLAQTAAASPATQNTCAPSTGHAG